MTFSLAKERSLELSRKQLAEHNGIREEEDKMDIRKLKQCVRQSIVNWSVTLTNLIVLNIKSVGIVLAFDPNNGDHWARE